MSPGEDSKADIAGQLLELGSELEQKGELANALRLYSQSLTAYATAQAYVLRGRVNERLGKFTPALADYRQALVCDPGYKPAMVRSARLLSRMN